VLVWNGQPMSLAEMQAASGQEVGSVIADPNFANAPTNRFDPATATSYDFCTQLDARPCD
jgi:hypothetical protein